MCSDAMISQLFHADEMYVRFKFDASNTLNIVMSDSGAVDRLVGNCQLSLPLPNTHQSVKLQTLVALRGQKRISTRIKYKFYVYPLYV